MGMIKFCSIALLMTTVMTTGTARYIPASNYILLEKLINQYDPSGVNYDYGEDDQDNQVKFLIIDKSMYFIDYLSFLVIILLKYCNFYFLFIKVIFFL